MEFTNCRRLRLVAAAAAAFMVAVSAVSAVAQPNLVTDPGFEDGGFGWTFLGTSGADNWDGSYHTGSWDAFINDLGGNAGSVSQVIPTVPGSTYNISFWLGSNGGNGNITVSFGGTVGFSQSLTTSAWQQFSFTAQATSYCTKFAFAAQNVVNTVFIDDVSITGDSRSPNIYSANGLRADVSVVQPGVAGGTLIRLASPPKSVALTPDCSQVYAPFAAKVAVINTATNQVSSTPYVPKHPRKLVFSSDGSLAFSAQYVDQSVKVLNTASGTVIATVHINGQTPYGIAITPDGSKILTANFNSNTVSVIDASTHMVIGTPIPVGFEAWDIAIGAFDSRQPSRPNATPVFAYVTNAMSGSVSVIDTSLNQVVATIQIGHKCEGIAIVPNGRKVYVANYDNDTVSVIDVSTNTVINTISLPAGSGPTAIALSHDGYTAYVANRGNSNGRPVTNTISVISTSSETLVDTITDPQLFGPQGIAVQ